MTTTSSKYVFVMQITCNQFTYDLLSDHTHCVVWHHSQPLPPSRVVCASWAYIWQHLRRDSHTAHTERLYIVHGLGDVNPTDQYQHVIDRINHRSHTRYKVRSVGDTVGGSHATHVSSPWSRGIWLGSDWLPVTPRPPRWMCMMSRARDHRTRTELCLMKHHRLWQIAHDYSYDSSPNWARTHKLMWKTAGSYHVSQLPRPRIQPEFWGMNDHRDGDLCEPHHRASIELVAETWADWFNLSEKTTKPMRAGIPFVIIGARHSLRRLRQMGFRTFDPWISESYDDEPNLDRRIHSAVTAMQTWLLNPQHGDHIRRVCDHNQHHLKQIRQHADRLDHRCVRKILAIIRREVA